MDFAVIEVKDVKDDTEYIPIYARASTGEPFVLFVRNFKHRFFVPVESFRGRLMVNGMPLSNEDFDRNVNQQVAHIAEAFRGSNALIPVADVSLTVRRNGYGFHHPEPFVQIESKSQYQLEQRANAVRSLVMQPFDADLTSSQRYMTQRSITGAGWFHVKRVAPFPQGRTDFPNLLLVDDADIFALPDKSDPIPYLTILTFDFELLCLEDKKFPDGTNNQIIQISVQLDVFINGKPTQEFAFFGLRPTNRINDRKKKEVTMYTFYTHEKPMILALLQYVHSIASSDAYNDTPLQIMLCKALAYINIIEGVQLSEIEQFARLRKFILSRTQSNFIFPEFNVFKKLSALRTRPSIEPDDRPWLVYFLKKRKLTMVRLEEDAAELAAAHEAITKDKMLSNKEKGRQKRTLTEKLLQKEERRFFKQEGMMNSFVDFLEIYAVTKEQTDAMQDIHKRIWDVVRQGSYADEAEMLVAFRDYIKRKNPDKIMTYNGDMFDFPVWEEACARLNIKDGLQIGRPCMSKNGYMYEGHVKIGPIRDGSVTTGSHKERNITIPGRQNVDVIRVCFKELKKLKTHNLETTSQFILNKSKLDVPPEMIAVLFNGSAEDRRELGEYNMEDSILPREMMRVAKWDDIIIQMARITGINMQDVYGRGASMMGTYLYATHAFRKNIVLPTIRSEKETFKGAFVYPPRGDMYLGHVDQDTLEWVADLIFNVDFSGMYPSIILHWFLCMSTLIQPERLRQLFPSTALADEPYANENVFLSASGHYYVKNGDGFLPSILRMAVDERQRAKDNMKLWMKRLAAFNDFLLFLKEVFGEGKKASDMDDAHFKEYQQTVQSGKSAFLSAFLVSCEADKEKMSALIVKLDIEVAPDFITLHSEIIQMTLTGLRAFDVAQNDVDLKHLSIIAAAAYIRIVEIERWIQYYDIRQLGMKIVGNSMYGIIGSFRCKWPKQEVAASVTAQGQWMTKNVVEPTLLELDGDAKVIYGDTDSLFALARRLRTFLEVKAFAALLAKRVNEKLNSKDIRLEPEHVLLRAIFPKDRMKTYAAMEIFEDKEPELLLRGYSFKKSNYPPFTKEVGMWCATALVMRGLALDEVLRYLHEVNEKLENINNSKDVDFIEKFMLTIKWGKDYATYKNNNMIPMLNAENNRLLNTPFFQGDRIPFFHLAIPGSSAAERVGLGTSVLSTIISIIEGAEGLTRPVINVGYYREHALLNPLLPLFPNQEHRLRNVIVGRGNVFLHSNPFNTMHMDQFLTKQAGQKPSDVFYDDLERQNQRKAIEETKEKQFNTKKRKFERERETAAMANTMSQFLVKTQKTVTTNDIMNYKKK